MADLLVSGAGGYVGGRIVEAARTRYEVHGLWRHRQPPAGGRAYQVDLGDGPSVRRLLADIRPNVVIHAAYEIAAGAEPNERWTRSLLEASRAIGARFLFLSTDLVFDGRRGCYHEDEPPSPIMAYGVWKARLEAEVLAAGGVVARTALVWGLDPVADNVERLVLAPLRAGGTPRLFEDEWRTPTEVHELAEGLLRAAELVGPRVLHLAGPERLTRLELGRMLARHQGYDPARLPPFRRAELAPERPADTSLDSTATIALLGVHFRGPSAILAE